VESLQAVTFLIVNHWLDINDTMVWGQVLICYLANKSCPKACYEIWNQLFAKIVGD